MTQRSLLILLLIGTLLASCAPSGAGTPTPDINTLVAANAQTMVAALFQTQTALAPSATNTALPTVTPLPSSTALALSTATTFIQQPVYIAATATPTGTYYTATPLASSLGVGCNNLRLINSYTDPEGPFVRGQRFVQYWQVENNGTCDWLYLYTLEFASGDKLGEGSSQRLGNKFPPGKWTTFSVVLHTPDNKSGTFTASWRLTDGAGKAFGAVLPVSITVGGATNTPKPDTAATNVAQTVAAGVQQTATAAAQQTAVQAAINTAVAATATCAAAVATPPVPPCQ